MIKKVQETEDNNLMCYIPRQLVFCNDKNKLKIVFDRISQLSR